VNSRLDTLQAAILLAKLAIFDDEIKLRQRVADDYEVMLRAVGLTTTPKIVQNCTSAWAQYTVRVANRDTVQEALAGMGVPTIVHYPIPLNKQPAVAVPSARLPTGDMISAEVLSLPFGPYLSNDHQQQVVEAIGSLGGAICKVDNP
jgi:UDP-2-acetamido-2-deoxy-ribo-hexuluronate aminotransferase